jgi:hypothetical protein
MISKNKCAIEAVIVPPACGLAYTLWSETVRHVSRSGGLSSLRASAGNFREPSVYSRKDVLHDGPLPV